MAARRTSRGAAHRAGARGRSPRSPPPSPRSCSCWRPVATRRPPRPPSSCARPRRPPSARRRSPPAPTCTCAASSPRAGRHGRDVGALGRAPTAPAARSCATAPAASSRTRGTSRASSSAPSASTRLTDARGLLERQARRTIAENPGFDPAQLRAFTAYAILRDLLDTPSAAALRAEAYRELARTPGLRRAGDTVIARVGDVELRLTIDAGRVRATERRLLRRSDQIPGPPGVVDRSEVVARGSASDSARGRGLRRRGARAGRAGRPGRAGRGPRGRRRARAPGRRPPGSRVIRSVRASAWA